MEADFRNLLQRPLEELEAPSGIANVLSIQPLQSAPALPNEYVRLCRMLSINKREAYQS